MPLASVRQVAMTAPTWRPALSIWMRLMVIPAPMGGRAVGMANDAEASDSSCEPNLGDRMVAAGPSGAERLPEMGTGATTAAVTPKVLVGSSTEVAVMVAVPAVAGAVQVLPDQVPWPLESQVTVLVTPPVTVAVKAWV